MLAFLTVENIQI